MFHEDQEALAAEYVLGTLSAEEREHAEALRSSDPEFEASVRQWERRLGELNVMVEAVEPPAQLWDNIKSKIRPVEGASAVTVLRQQESASPLATLAAGLESMEAASALPSAAGAAAAAPVAAAPVAAEPATPEPTPPKVDRGASTVYLARRVRRWRRMTVVFGALAALLAAYIGVWQLSPEVMPPQLRLPARGVMAQSARAAVLPQRRFVAVLQHEPTAPAFLLTLDMQRRMLFVRRISATPEAGKSYQLWVVLNGAPAPPSLGIIGIDEFTERALPESYDVEMLHAAKYAVTLEPAGGSPSDAPTGPVLFTGTAVESLPASLPQDGKM